MDTGVVEAIYKIKYFLSIKKHREKAKKTEENGEFCLDGAWQHCLLHLKLRFSVYIGNSI